ncbi:MAG: DUF2520 domain-containing protein [Chitinophagaceae bacterium]|nr:MAG: DUF2520 domain-containing protein [Chitinophagaceae bacterium]
MNIVIIGSGNVAAVLGRKFRAAGHEILQVMSRNAKAASDLAYEWDTESANYMTLLNRDAELYVIAVSDSAISSVIADLRLPHALVVHTAAAVPKSVLAGVSPHYGVLYPLQSLRREMPALPDIPLYIDASDDRSRTQLEALAASLSLRAAMPAGDELRVKLHLAAVLVSNFTNHLYAVAEDYCRAEGIDFAQLYPLILETAARLPGNHAVSLQTGPAVRGDRETIAKHLELLEARPALAQLYRVLSDSIQQITMVK